jgi:Lysine methyltransferase
MEYLRDAGLMLMSFLDGSITAGPIDMSSLRETLAIAKKRRLSCIELGTGCGIVGLGLAQALPNCDILLTDLPEAEDFVKQNMLATRPASNTVISFEAVDWEKDLPISVSSKEFDLILVADCTYNPSSVPSLVRVLATLVARSRNAIVLLAHKVRHSSEAVFFERITDAGFYQDGHVAIPLPSSEGLWSPNDPRNVDLYIFHTSNSDISPRTSRQ